MWTWARPFPIPTMRSPTVTAQTAATASILQAPQASFVSVGIGGFLKHGSLRTGGPQLTAAIGPGTSVAK